MIGTASPTATTDLLPNIVRVAPPSTAPAKASRRTPRSDSRRPHAEALAAAAKAMVAPLNDAKAEADLGN